MSPDKTASKEALKSLRESRGPALAEVQARLKEQVKIDRDILRLLTEGPRTPLSLAEALGVPTTQIFWHLVALKKYGKVSEDEPDGDYFLYRITK